MISLTWLLLSEKGKLGAYAMKLVATGAHLPAPWLFEPAKCPDDRAERSPSLFVAVKDPTKFLTVKASNIRLRRRYLSKEKKNWFSRLSRRMEIAECTRQPRHQSKLLMVITVSLRCRHVSIFNPLFFSNSYWLLDFFSSSFIANPFVVRRWISW